MDEMGKHFWWKTVGLVIGLGLLGLLCMVLFTGLVARFGVIAGLVIIFGILMLIMYRADRKEQHRIRRRVGSAAQPPLPQRPKLVQAVADEAGEPDLLPGVDEVGVTRVDAAGAQNDGLLQLGIADDDLERRKRDGM